MSDASAVLKDDLKSDPGVHPYRRARDASTLVLVDRTRDKPHVLLGRRHHGHAFMPGKFVFPGGRTEPADRYAPISAPLHPDTEAKLLAGVVRPSAAKARALALAAIRETYEETGLLLGTSAKPARLGKRVAASAWRPFLDAGFVPDLSAIAFIARAITPPGRSRRFDTRFFTMDANAVAHRIDGVVGENAELVELVWVPIEETQHLDLPGITRAVLRELQARIEQGFGHELPVPFFHLRSGKMIRELI